jgi:hypothetical protein
VVLLLLVGLSIYKPRGMTRYGWRKQHEQRHMADLPHDLASGEKR